MKTATAGAREAVSNIKGNVQDSAVAKKMKKKLKSLRRQSMKPDDSVMAVASEVKDVVVTKAQEIFTKLKEKITTKMHDVMADVSAALQETDTIGSTDGSTLLNLMNHEDKVMGTKTTDMVLGPLKLQFLRWTNQIKAVGSILVAIACVPALAMDLGKTCHKLNGLMSLEDFVVCLTALHCFVALSRIQVHRILAQFESDHEMRKLVERSYGVQSTRESDVITQILGDYTHTESQRSGGLIGGISRFDKIIHEALATGEEAVLAHYFISTHPFYRIVNLCQLALVSGAVLGCYYAYSLECLACEAENLLWLVQMNSIGFFIVFTYILIDVMAQLAAFYVRLAPKRSLPIIAWAKKVDNEKLGFPVLEIVVTAVLELDKAHIRELLRAHRERELDYLKTREETLERRINHVTAEVEKRKKQAALINRVVNKGMEKVQSYELQRLEKRLDPNSRDPSKLSSSGLNEMPSTEL